MTNHWLQQKELQDYVAELVEWIIEQQLPPEYACEYCAYELDRAGDSDLSHEDILAELRRQLLP